MIKKSKNILLKYFSSLEKEKQLKINYFIEQINLNPKNSNFFVSELKKELFNNNQKIDYLSSLKKIVSPQDEKEKIQMDINFLEDTNEKIYKILGLKKEEQVSLKKYKQIIYSKILIIYNFIKNYKYKEEIFLKMQKYLRILYYKYINKNYWKIFFKNLLTIKFWEDLYYYCFVELQKPKVFSDSLFDQIDLHVRLVLIFFYLIFLYCLVGLVLLCWLLSVFGIL